MTDSLKETRNAHHHTWCFRRMGGFDQVLLQSGADLLALDQLDQKLWVALSCPTKGLEFDSKTLELLDGDSDGRIRATEIITAIKWIGSLLKNPDDLLKGESSLPLSAIIDTTPAGRQILASARQILTNLGKGSASSITAEDTSDAKRIFSDTKFNGDGVITADSADDEVVKGVIEDIIKCVGSEEDRSGKPGINQEHVDQFFAEAFAYSEWWSKAENDAVNVLPLGEQTVSAAQSLGAVYEKVEDYFTRCLLAEFDGNAGGALNPIQTEYEALAKKRLSINAEEIASFPIARIEAGRPLPLKVEVNPAWAAAIADFDAKVVKPLLGDKTALALDEWRAINKKFNDYRLWLKEKVGEPVEDLGLDRVREVLSGNFQEIITRLLDKDKALEAEANEIASVDKLVRYYENLFTLVRNFVSFRDFYELKEKAIFQSGTLYLDGRSCDLCVTVDEVAKHSNLASLGRIYLAYCACARNGGADKMQIAAAFTDGDADNLMVGRNGVFYDRKGRDWDATIVTIIEHPISIRQAFWAPYKRFARMISEQIEKIAATREKEIDAKAAAGITDVSKKAGTPASAAEQTFDIAKFAGIFAAIGLAIGAIGTAIASLVTGVMAMKLWKMPLALGGLVLVISGPSMVIAYLKLHMRNLSPILDANGWAVNARALINIPFGNRLTGVAKLPKGAQRSLRDPFEEKRKPLKVLILILILSVLLLLWEEGYLHEWWNYISSDQKTVIEQIHHPEPGGVEKKQ